MDNLEQHKLMLVTAKIKISDYHGYSLAVVRYIGSEKDLLVV